MLQRPVKRWICLCVMEWVGCRFAWMKVLFIRATHEREKRGQSECGGGDRELGLEMIYS